MADTQRNLAALLLLAPDQTTGDVSPQDLRDMLVSLLGGFGNIFTNDGVTAQSITGGAAAVKMTGFVGNGPASGCTADKANNKLVANLTGKYMVVFQCSFSGSANITFQFHVRNGGAEITSLGCERKLGAGGDIGSCSIVGIGDFTAAQDIEVYVECDGVGAQSITPKQLSLAIKYIGN